jgi:uncharacterized membrane protein YphA (DoxX/SURF4 family)
VNPIQILDRLRALDFLSPLALRLYLAPVFLATGLNKAMNFEHTVEWFGNPDWGLGLPFPWLNALMATATELGGAVLLLLGLGVRFVSLPLMFVMIVAAATVHAPNGWFVIADPVSCLFGCDGVEEAAVRLGRARDILSEHGNYDWLTETGSFVVLNNGVEFVTAYFIMLLTLFFQGAGRFVSLDDWIAKRFVAADGAAARR